MAAVNACFEHDDGEAATNGGSQLQQATSGTNTTHTAQQSGGSPSGNNPFDTKNEIARIET